MDIYEAGRHKGKTLRMCAWLRNSPDNVLIVTSEAERRRILMDYFDEEERPSYQNRIITPYEREKLRGRRNTRLGIDNVDILLGNLFGHNIEVMTLTLEERDAKG